MFYASEVARRNGYLTIHIPAQEVLQDRLSWLTNDIFGDQPHLFNQHEWTANWFKQFLKDSHNAEIIKQVPLKHEYKYSPKSIDGSSLPDVSPKTLAELAEAGFNAHIAPVVLYDFLAEIRLMTEFPVLVTIDNINDWDANSEFLHPRTVTPIPARNLSAIDAFSAFQRVAPTNGVSMFTYSSRATYKKLPLHFDTRYVQSHESPNYSAIESKHVIIHYSISNVFPNPVDDQLISTLQLLSGNIGKELRRVSVLMTEF
jgi:hypothetical protein